jgi:hypothetical protein
MSIDRIRIVTNKFIVKVALICVLISAGISDRDDGERADSGFFPSAAKVSAVHTRNAVLVFAIIGLILIMTDTILYMTNLIRHVPKMSQFQSIVSVLSLI